MLLELLTLHNCQHALLPRLGFSVVDSEHSLREGASLLPFHQCVHTSGGSAPVFTVHAVCLYPFPLDQSQVPYIV